MWWLILQMWISRCEKPLHHWRKALKSSFAKELKQSYCEIWSLHLQYLQSYLENFHPSLSGCSALAGNQQYITDRYIIEIWPVLMACTWKTRVLLAVFWDKISIFHLGQTEHRSERGDGSLCAQHRSLISIISCRATQWTRETGLNRLNNRDFHLHALIFAGSVPCTQVAFSSEPSRNLLCTTILDIISTCCEYVLSLRRARSPPPHAARDRARGATAPSTVAQHFDCARANGSLFALSVYLISFTSYGWLENARIRAKSLEKLRFSQFLLDCSPRNRHVGRNLVLKHDLRFWVFCSTICWFWWSTNSYERFDRNKIAVS